MGEYSVITSLCDQDLTEIGLAPSVRDQVERLARLSATANQLNWLNAATHLGTPTWIATLRSR